MLTDLPKASDCMSYELLIAKLNAHRFDIKPLNFISAYLNCRKEKAKIDGSFSDFLNILLGIPQSSTVGSLLFIS